MGVKSGVGKDPPEAARIASIAGLFDDEYRELDGVREAGKHGLNASEVCEVAAKQAIEKENFIGKSIVVVSN